MLLVAFTTSCRYGYDLVGDPAAGFGDSGSLSAGGTSSSAAGDPGTGSGGGATASASSATGGSGGGVGGSSNPPALPIVHCDQLRKLGGRPELDGVLEAGMYLERFDPVGWSGTSPDVPAGNELAFSVGWFDTGLYFYLEVTDPERNPADAATPVWQGDSVEIYVDHDAVYPEPFVYDYPGTFQFVVGAPADDDTDSNRADRFIPEGLHSAWAPGGWIGRPTASGYVVEAFVEAADLDLPAWDLMAGERVGFDIGYNVSFPVGQTGPSGNRDGQAFLKIREPPNRDGSDLPFLASDVFCSPELLEPRG